MPPSVNVPLEGNEVIILEMVVVVCALSGSDIVSVITSLESSLSDTVELLATGASFTLVILTVNVLA